MLLRLLFDYYGIWHTKQRYVNHCIGMLKKKVLCFSFFSFPFLSAIWNMLLDIFC